MWMLPLYLHVNQKSDYMMIMMMMMLMGVELYYFHIVFLNRSIHQSVPSISPSIGYILVVAGVSDKHILYYLLILHCTCNKHGTRETKFKGFE